MADTKYLNRFSSHLHSLDEIFGEIWTSLTNAERTPADPWSLATLGTVTNNQALLRLVVIRGASQQTSTVTFHTDVRSPKVKQIEINPAVCLHFYDWEERIQLVARGSVTVHLDDDIANEQWNKTPLSSRRAYLGTLPPSQFSDQRTVNLPEEFQVTLPTEEEVSAGRKHFCVITCQIKEFDFLCLQTNGNIRAGFWKENNVWNHSWLTP